MRGIILVPAKKKIQQDFILLVTSLFVKTFDCRQLALGQKFGDLFILKFIALSGRMV